jgi:hypothetical protein
MIQDTQIQGSCIQACSGIDNIELEANEILNSKMVQKATELFSIEKINIKQKT